MSSFLRFFSYSHSSSFMIIQSELELKVFLYFSPDRQVTSLPWRTLPSEHLETSAIFAPKPSRKIKTKSRIHFPADVSHWSCLQRWWWWGFVFVGVLAAKNHPEAAAAQPEHAFKGLWLISPSFPGSLDGQNARFYRKHSLITETDKNEAEGENTFLLPARNCRVNLPRSNDERK